MMAGGVLVSPTTTQKNKNAYIKGDCMARGYMIETSAICLNCGYRFEDLKEIIEISPFLNVNTKADRFDPCICPRCKKRILGTKFFPESCSYAVIVE